MDFQNVQRERQRDLFLFGAPSTCQFRPGPDGQPIEIPQNPIIIKPPPLQPIKVSPGTVLNYDQLEQFVNGWLAELRTEEEKFYNEAARCNFYNNILTSNAEKIEDMSAMMDDMKVLQTRLENGLDFVKVNQLEFEAELTRLEASFPLPPSSLPVDTSGERAKTFALAEQLDSEFQEMRDDLKTIVSDMYALVPKDKKDPISQILYILNEHTNALQWIEAQLVEAKNHLSKVDEAREWFLKDYDECISRLVKTQTQ